MLKGDIPVIFCVLTDNNRQQGIDRSGGKHGNKGTEAAVAAIKMADLRKQVRSIFFLNFSYLAILTFLLLASFLLTIFRNP